MIKNSLFKENFQESVNLRIKNFGKLMINLEKQMDLKEKWKQIGQKVTALQKKKCRPMCSRCRLAQC